VPRHFLFIGTLLEYIADRYDERQTPKSQVMKTTPLSPAVLLLMVLFTSSPAADNAVILSGGINHHFSTTLTEQPVLKPGLINAYSMSLQYIRQTNGTFDVGLRTMFHNFNAVREEGVSDVFIPVFLTLNYRLLKIGANNQVQLAAGPVFHLNISEGLESETLKKSLETGYGIGVFSNHNFRIWSAIGVYAEGGLLYEKNSFKSSFTGKTKVTALFSLGLVLNYQLINA